MRRAEAAEPEDGETREGRAIVLKGQGCRDSLQMHRRKECVTEPRTPAQGPVSEGAARTGMRSHDLRGELASYMGPPANKHETLSLGLAGRDHAPRVPGPPCPPTPGSPLTYLPAVSIEPVGRRGRELLEGFEQPLSVQVELCCLVCLLLVVFQLSVIIITIPEGGNCRFINRFTAKQCTSFA